MNEAHPRSGGAAVADGGHVVVVSSIAGIAGNRGQSNYAASKAGVIGLVHALGRDRTCADRGITVNAVAPGFIETEMTAPDPVRHARGGPPAQLARCRAGCPVDVAETIAWFAQDASAGVTGQVVRVCGQSLLGA